MCGSGRRQNPANPRIPPPARWLGYCSFRFVPCRPPRAWNRFPTKGVLMSYESRAHAQPGSRRDVGRALGWPLAAAALSLVVSTGVASAAPLPWPQFHGRAAHQGANPFEKEVGVDNVINLQLEWTGLGSF